MTVGRTMIGLGLLVAASAAGAQAPATRDVRFGVAGGASFSTGTLGSDWGETGWHLQGALQLAPAGLPFGIRAELLYHRMGEKSESLFDPGTGETYSLAMRPSFTGGTANMVWSFPAQPASTIRPYLIGGLGVYSTRLDVTYDLGSIGGAGSGNDSKTSVGLNAGGGVQFQLGTLDAFVEARFHNVFDALPDMNSESVDRTKSATFVPISFGLLF